MTTSTEDPRVAHTRSVVVAAAAELLAEEGFERLTMDELAKRSGVARSTIYRNWPDRHLLMVAAFNTACPFEPPPDTGDVANDLRTVAERLSSVLTNEALGRILPSMIGAAAHDPEIARAKEAFAESRITWVRRLIERGVERGEVQPDIDVQLMAIRFVSPFFHRWLVTGGDLDQDFIDRQVNATMRELTARVR